MVTEAQLSYFHLGSEYREFLENVVPTSTLLQGMDTILKRG